MNADGPYTSDDRENSKSSQEKVQYHLVLYNDDTNTFDFVIETLINIMDFHETQAEQLAMLAHYRGMMTIKKGPYTELNPYCKKLRDKGLTSSVVSN